MGFKYFLIVFFSIISCLIICQFGIGKQWKHSLLKYKWQSLLLIVWFGSVFLGGGETIEEANHLRTYRAIILGCLGLLATCGVLTRFSCFRKSGNGALWFLLYAFFGMVSAVYSPDYVITLWKSFEVFVFVVMGVYISRFINDIEGVRWIVDIISLIMLYLVFSIMYGVIIVPAEAMPAFSVSKGAMAFAAYGVFPAINANSGTQYAAILISLSLNYIFSLKKYSFISMLVIGIGCITLILTHSRTSILGLVLAVSVMLIVGRHYILAGLLGVIIFTGMLFGLGDLSKAYFYRGQSEAVFSTMSGRLDFWEIVWNVFLQSPIVGHGFYAQKAILGTSTVDNTYLQVLVNLGVVGLFIFLMPIFKITRQLLKTYPNKLTETTEKLVWFQLSSIFIILIMRSLTGPTFQDFHSNLCLMMLLIVSVNGYKNIIIKGRMDVKSDLKNSMEKIK